MPRRPSTTKQRASPEARRSIDIPNETSLPQSGSARSRSPVRGKRAALCRSAAVCAVDQETALCSISWFRSGSTPRPRARGRWPMSTSPIGLTYGRATPTFGQSDRSSVRVAEKPSELSRKMANHSQSPSGDGRPRITSSGVGGSPLEKKDPARNPIVPCRFFFANSVKGSDCFIIHLSRSRSAAGRGRDSFPEPSRHRRRSVHPGCSRCCRTDPLVSSLVAARKGSVPYRSDH
jgi:hypothetical protein